MLKSTSLQRRAAYSLSIGNCPHPPTKMVVFQQFLVNFPLSTYINIFHKTEVQTVILRCWLGLPQLVQKLWHKTQMGQLLIDERIRSSSLKVLWLKWNKLSSKVPLCYAVVHLLWRVSSLDGGLQFHALKLFYLIDENGIISSNSIHCGLVILTLLLKISSASFTFSLAYRVFKFKKRLLSYRYTQYWLISTTVNVSVLAVLIFSQNFSTNVPYVVLNFLKFSDTMVFWCLTHIELHTMYCR